MSAPTPSKSLTIRGSRGPKKKYMQENFLAAVEAVKQQGMSVREAAKTFAVPRSKLLARVKKTHGTKDGRPTTLTLEEENMIKDRIKVRHLHTRP